VSPLDRELARTLLVHSIPMPILRGESKCARLPSRRPATESRVSALGTQKMPDPASPKAYRI
jgi:hypothetical protein